ncbi:LysR family transcriptional regulator [Pseudomonas costantinii]|uniref:LysR family transcriptional regulator n=1 Tax=Pseudomonas costantinii TaxID=168469 RepID=UPI00159FD3B5|nr:LysR family transcriptional regulator [Pseudomonas costantinii]NVZ68419.1 LysR family transcriptional regulator [Pseudomonas costantinii]
MLNRKLRIHAPAIYYFDMVRRCHSIREAARRLNVASSAVNRQILKLEDEMGTALFDRLPGGLRVTAAGEILTRHITLLLQDVVRVRGELDGLHGVQTGHVEIATVEGAAVELLPAALKRMRQRYPKVTIGVTVQGSQSIPGAVINGQADVGLAFALPRSNEITQLCVGHFRLGALMTPEHPLARETHVSYGQCCEYGVIQAKSELSVHHLIAPLHKRTTAASKPLLHSNSMELARQLVRQQLGIAFQTRIGIEADLARGELLHIPLSDQGAIFSDLGVYARKDRDLPVAVQALAHLLGEEIALREREETPSTPRIS